VSSWAPHRYPDRGSLHSTARNTEIFIVLPLVGATSRLSYERHCRIRNRRCGCPSPRARLPQAQGEFHRACSLRPYRKQTLPWVWRCITSARLVALWSGLSPARSRGPPSHRSATRIAGRSRPPPLLSQPTTARNPAEVPTSQGPRAEAVRYLLRDGRAERSCPAPTVSCRGVSRCRTDRYRPRQRSTLVARDPRHGKPAAAGLANRGGCHQSRSMGSGACPHCSQ
jgi:hypothetical protein